MTWTKMTMKTCLRWSLESLIQPSVTGTYVWRPDEETSALLILQDDGIDDEDEDGVMGPGGDMLGMGYDGDEAEDEEGVFILALYQRVSDHPGMWDVEGDEDEDPDMDDLDEAEDMDEEEYVSSMRIQCPSDRLAMMRSI